jgi:hypothetical protein
MPAYVRLTLSTTITGFSAWTRSRAASATEPKSPYGGSATVSFAVATSKAAKRLVCAMALVIVGSAFDLAGQHGKYRLAAAQGLDLTLLMGITPWRVDLGTHRQMSRTLSTNSG